MLAQTLSIMSANWGMRPIRPEGVTDGLPSALFAFKDEEFRIMLTVAWDDSNSLLVFDAEPGEGVVPEDAQPIALELMNSTNTEMDIGRFEMREVGGEMKVHCRAAAILTTAPTPELIEALLKDSLTAMNSVKGIVQHGP